MQGNTAVFPLESGLLLSYELDYGIPLWSVPIVTRLQPTICDGLVFVVEASSIAALGLETGAVAWRTPLTEPLAAPLVALGGWVVAATTDGEIIAIRAVDGGVVWRRAVAARLQVQPALVGDRLYAGFDDGQVVALRVDTGEPVWTQQIGGRASGLLADTRRVFVGSTDNYLYGLMAATGAISWRWPTGADLVGRPILDDRNVYFSSMDNLLRAVDQRNGAQRWKRGLTLRPTRGPAGAGDALLVSGQASGVPAYLRSNGSPAGEVTTEGDLVALPHVVLDESRAMIVLVTRSLSEGTVVRALRHQFEPAAVAFAPLPNVVPLQLPPGFVLPTTAPAGGTTPPTSESPAPDTPTSVPPVPNPTPPASASPAPAVRP